MKTWIITACILLVAGFAVERSLIRRALKPVDPEFATLTPATVPAATAIPLQTRHAAELPSPPVSTETSTAAPAEATGAAVKPVPRAPAPARRPSIPRQISPPDTPAIRIAAGRAALASVGTDPAANSAWLQVINDDSVPAEERKNLIEDLNEDGFADPGNLTADDLPVIENRLSIIEQLAPSAIDDTNYAAFEEAYKDLTNMRARLAANTR